MDRRTYITAAGVVLAGCSGTGDETETASPTNSATSSPTPTETAAPTETETASPTPEPTATATPEPSEVELELRAAVDDLDAALEEYAAPNMTFLETNTSTGPFPRREVREHLSAAKEHLYTAEQEMSDGTPSELRTQQQRLFGVYWFLYWSTSIQERINETPDSLESVENVMYTGNLRRVNDRRDSFEGEIESIASDIDDLEEDSDPEDATAPCELTQDQYTAKVDQFNTGVADLEAIVEELDDLRRLISDLADGLGRYNAEDYSDASTTFYEVTNSFSEFASNLDVDAYQPAYNGTLNRMSCAAEALSVGCGELETAATAGSNGNSSKQEAAEDNARDSFEECDVVFDHVTPLIEFYGVGEDQQSLATLLGKATAIFGS